MSTVKQFLIKHIIKGIKYLIVYLEYKIDNKKKYKKCPQKISENYKSPNITSWNSSTYLKEFYHTDQCLSTAFK